MQAQTTNFLSEKSPVSLILHSVFESGYNASENNTMRGISGRLHEFAVVARSSSGKRVVINIVGEEKLCELALVKLRAITYDCSPDASILLAMPNANRLSKELAPSYGIKLIEGKDIYDVCSKLKDTLKTLDA